MASSPTTSEGGSGLEDLENELALQRALLVSIREQEDTPSNRETTSRIQAEVTRLKKALSQGKVCVARHQLPWGFEEYLSANLSGHTERNSGHSSFPTMQLNAQALSFGASSSAAHRKRSIGSSHLGPVLIG